MNANKRAVPNTAPRSGGEPGAEAVAALEAAPSALLPSAFPPHTEDDDEDAVGNAEILPFMSSLRRNRETSTDIGDNENALQGEGGSLGNENEDPDPEALLDAKEFSGFFTVVEDTAAGEHHHPHVRYVFSDDDPEHVTSALLHVLDPHGRNTADNRDDEPTSVKSAADSAQERLIIVDIGSDGQTIVAAKSLSPAWQISEASMVVAPTFRDDAAAEEAGLMLKIEGREAESSPGEVTPQQLLRSNETTDTDELLSKMHRLSEQFHAELDVLQKMSRASDPSQAGGTG